MPLHLLKLAVGPPSIEALEAHIARHRTNALEQGSDPAPSHVTRMAPKRASEIAGQGSIYWVIKGTLCCRQAISRIEPHKGEDGIARCRLVFDPQVVLVRPRPCRPFQGWRYLTAADAPPDIDRGTLADLAEIPENLRRELASLGLI